MKGPDIEAFLATNRRNGWIESEGMKVYVRNRTRAFNGVFHQVLDIANVEVELRGHGVFTAWLKEAEAAAARHGMHAVYVESIINPRLLQFLAAKGYFITAEYLTPNAHKLCNQLQKEAA